MHGRLAIHFVSVLRELRMARATTTLIAAVLVLGSGVVACGRSNRVPEPAPAARASSTVPGASAGAPALPATVDTPPILASAGPQPDGRQVAELPPDAPASVTFGVVLVTYRGAEGAPSGARTKVEALQKAKDLAARAKTNFDEAVAQGDRGSTSNAGTIPRGVLEPAVEYSLFTLRKGEVYGEPIDTPRGYWVLRRIE